MKKMKTINFTDTSSSNFLGRNGLFKSIGLTIFKIGDELIQLIPITSKNKLGRCSICVPVSSIPELIDTLKGFVEGMPENEKTTKIKRIKGILSVWGKTSCTELELDHSPCKNSIGDRISELIEEFYPNHVSAITYDDDIEIGWNDYDYEDLSDEIIDEIADIIDNYETDMLKTEKRCKD